MSTDNIVAVFAAASEGPMFREGFKTVRLWEIPEDRQAEAKRWVDGNGAIHRDDPVVLHETGTSDTARDSSKVQQGDVYWLIPRSALPSE